MGWSPGSDDGRPHEESEGLNMRKTGMRFTWRTTKNSDAINELKKNNIAFEYNRFGELTADFYGIGIFEKVDFEHVQGDVFEICIA